MPERDLSHPPMGRAWPAAGPWWRVAGAAVVALLSITWGSPARAEPPAWNPKPSPSEDIVLGLPCDQKMVFRRVATQEGQGGRAAGSVLDDRRIVLGRANPSTGYSDYLRQGYIAGAFADRRGRYYLIAKYETTRAQYASLMTAGCKAVAEPSQPVADISWYDAVEFTRRMTAHLLLSGKAELKKAVGQDIAHVRLPTEEEWEFAARGGLVVSAADFQAPRFPMTRTEVDTMWFNDPLSADGASNRIGMLDPNPLGLYDIYGNVAEMLIEPFHMNKAGREHGHAGGFISKGGSYLFTSADIASATRSEHRYFDGDTGEEYKAADLGFRVVLTAPALSGRNIGEIREEWERAGTARVNVGSDPIEQLSRLQREQSDLQLGRDIETIKQSIRRLAADENERQFRLLSGLILSSGKLIADIRRLSQRAKDRRALLGGFEFAEADVVRMNKEIHDDEDKAHDLNYVNHDLVVRIADEFSAEEIGTQADALVEEMKQRGLAEVSVGIRICAAIAKRAKAGSAELDRKAVLSLTLGTNLTP